MQSGTTTFRIYFYGGTPGSGNGTNVVVFIDGSTLGSMGLQLSTATG